MAASLTVAVLIVVGLAVTAVVRDEPPPPVARPSTADMTGADRFAADAGSDGARGDDGGDDDRDGDRGDDGGDDDRDGDRGDRERRDRAPFGAACRTTTEGSLVTAVCHNPYPEPDRLQLHMECARWWDVDSDSAPVEAGAAGYARLTGRCWKEVASAWVSHERVTP
ncbi:hypothetical protein [Streptomyces sp. NPDC050428]|uniref:hypothetical protein n=1 Tax=Streptomyces sp. NPDC050428 TaxID=3155757 RepID=UPI0034149DED